MKLLPYNLCDQICGSLYAKQGRIDHQMLMQRVSRGISCVAFVVGTSCLVDLHDGAFRILFGHFQRIHAVFQPSFIRRVDEDIQHIRFILQQEIGKVFVKVLEDAGVYKCTEEGRKAFDRFIASL